MLFNFKHSYFLLPILILAAALRFWNLSTNPPGLTWDEAALGYNSYSILKTGKDEYGEFLPIYLKSFGDYKPALYAYLTIPSILIFGLSEFSVRIPSVVFGILTVFIVYLLVKKLFSIELGLLSALMLSLSPWHIQFSRPAFEANIALFFNTLGIYLFVKAQEKRYLLIFSFLSFGLSLFTYQASKLFVPLIIGVLIFINRKTIKNDIYLRVALIVIIAFAGFLLTTTFLGSNTSRLSTLNVFAYRRSVEDLHLISAEDGLKNNDLLFQILHGEWWAYVRGISERYMIYFSPKMLFVDGDYSERHSVPDLGVTYYVSLLFVALGIMQIFRINRYGRNLVLFWLMISPIPAVLSRDLISILRAFNMVIPFTIIEASGLYLLIIKSNRVRFGYILLGIFITAFLINFIIYFDRYFIHAPKEFAKYWMSGYGEAYNQLQKLNGHFDQIVVTDFYGQPYIYYLFYTKYPPEKFQKQALLEQFTTDVETVRKIDNIEFKHINWPTDRGFRNTVFIGTPIELPEQDILPFKEYSLIKDVKFLNGEIALKVVVSK